MGYKYANPYDKCYIDGMYAGRFAIEDNTPIIGGVSYGEHRGEAVVVNPEGAPNTYANWFEETVARASLSGIIQRNRVLTATYDTVLERMPYSKAGVDEIVQARRGKKIDLSMFMKERVGVCRHQALAIAALLEMHKDDGNIRGTPRVNRNIRESSNGNRDGHAWARYTGNNGSITILDAAQHFMGSLDESVRRIPHGRWDYRNETDRT